jgi:hypothetical protein
MPAFLLDFWGEYGGELERNQDEEDGPSAGPQGSRPGAIGDSAARGDYPCLSRCDGSGGRWLGTPLARNHC